MKVHQITEISIAPGAGKFNWQKSASSGGGFDIFGPDGTKFGNVARKDQAIAGAMKLNRPFLKHGIDSPQLANTIKQMSKGPIKFVDLKSMGPPKPKGALGKAADGISKAAKKVPGTKLGAKILSFFGRTAAGKVFFFILAADDVLDDVDGWAQAYMANGCKENKQTDAYEIKIRRTIVENILFFATGVAMASTAVIRTLATFLAVLPVAGWIATAMAWVGAGVLASMIAKLLSKTSVAEWLADYFIGSMLGPAVLKVVGFPECPKESTQEDWENTINENLSLLEQKRKAQSSQLAKAAADEIKDTFKNDPELMKIIKATKKKAKAGKIEVIKKGGPQAARAVKAGAA